MENTSFFVSIIPPTKTYQQKKIAVRNGKPILYEPKEVKEVRKLFKIFVGQYAPKEPYDKPIKLTVQWRFPISSNHKEGEYKYTRPDLDNLQKLLQDVMTELGFWKDDSLICELNVSKVWSNKLIGIYIKIEKLYSID